MERTASIGFRLGRQSSRADLTRSQDPDAPGTVFFDFTDESSEGFVDDATLDEIPPGVKLMYAAYEGDLEGINDLIDSGADVNFRDIDHRTPLHVAACQGYKDAVLLLIKNGADVEAKDRWGSTALADAIHYKNHEVIATLEENGASGATPLRAPMQVKNSRDVPEYEIDPKEIDFTKSTNITKGTFRKALWRGIEVAVKQIGDDVFADEDKVRAFRDELALLQRVRHPNVVQFLGAVTQSTPMMIVTEYLPKGDLCVFLKAKGPLKPRTAIRFALDIARGVSYLHENKPEPIIHFDLEPANILRDDSGNLKVADFGVSKLLKAAQGFVEDRTLVCEHASYRYMAPELFKKEEIDTKVDVFSFALILQEMIEGCPPFPEVDEVEVPRLYAENHRPPFRAPTKHYSHGIKELIEDCWKGNPLKRPPFADIIVRLDHIYRSFGHKRRWKIAPLKCFQRSHSSLGSFGDSARSP